MKTLGRFVLIDNANKKQMFLQWRTQANLNHTLQNPPSKPMSYSTRKTLISDLKPIDSKNKKQPKIGRAKDLVPSPSMNQLTCFVYANPQRQSTKHSKTEAKTFYRTRSLGKFSRHSSKSIERNNKRVDIERLKKTITEADKRKGRTIGVLKMRREGLRFKIRHQFFAVHSNINHEAFCNLIKQSLFEQFHQIADKKVYLFHLGKEPINNIQHDLNKKQYIIYADVYPKFDIPFQMQMKLFQQASLIQEQIKQKQMELQALKDEYDISENQIDAHHGEEQFQWQKIKNVSSYVDKLVDNPVLTKKKHKQKTEKNEFRQWYEQKYTLDEQKKGQKNPFFDVQSHFPKQTNQTEMLQKAAIKVDQLPCTYNKHEIKQHPVENMMQKIKRQLQNAQNLKKQENDRIRTIGYKSSKYFFKQLDDKNIPLVNQNIPYIMEKYGINRAQAYNLYNLYKSLQKISAMRLFNDNQHRRVKQKGIDRKTFDEGLKGLQINPGEQVIKNICYFPEFITWEEFIKIISISMRKTPKSKLQAILEGLGSNDRGFLTVEQIGIMVGSSLQKIFGKDEPELRQYFVNVVMKQLDKDKSGTIQIEELKEHVLEKGIQSLDLVSYLMLNS